MKSAKLLILLLCSLLLLAEKSWARQDARTSPQFNFDDDYQGEDIGKKSNNGINDPFESMNRKVFAFNEFVDKNIALPVVRQYHKHVPHSVRTSAAHFINNLSAPFSVVNSLMQGEGENAMASFSSFLINSTIGVGGLFDVAGKKEIKYNEEDLGQTFAKYGSKPGPYLVVPLPGPSDVRDFSGLVIEKVVSPLSFNVLNAGGSRDFVSDEVAISLAITGAVVARDSLIEVVDDIRKNSFDPYSTIRSAYLQKRQALISNQ